MRKVGLGRQAVPVRGRATSAPRASCSCAGPNVFPGYWRNPEATAAAFRDGWLLHGRRRRARRRGQLPDQRPAQGDGRLRRRERLSGRDRVRAARASARSRDAAVVGVPDERWGEVCVAFVVRSSRRVERRAARALPRAARALQGAEGVPHRRRAAAQLDGQGQKSELVGGDRVTDVVARRTSTGGRSRSAASTRAAGCSTRPSGSSASSATTTRRSSSWPRSPASPRAPSTSTSTRRRRSSTSSCATSTAACGTR